MVPRLILFCLLAFWPVWICAEDAVYRAGDWVVITGWDVHFERNGQPTGKAEFGDAYSVGSFDGQTLWIPSIQASLNASDVVLYEKALPQFTKAVEQNPRLSIVLSSATFLRKAGKQAEAIADYDRAIDLLPSEASLFIGRGNSLRKIGKFERAEADYDDAIRLNADEFDGWNGRGLASRIEKLCRSDRRLHARDRYQSQRLVSVE